MLASSRLEERKLKDSEKGEKGMRAYCQPDDNVGVYWIASTAGVLLVSKRFDHYGVI